MVIISIALLRIVLCKLLLFKSQCWLKASLNSNNSFGSFSESEQNAFIDIPTSFVGGVLLANSPQLLLSFCYLTYNNLFTRLQMAREWSLYSKGYHPLRVTDPKV